LTHNPWHHGWRGGGGTPDYGIYEGLQGVHGDKLDKLRELAATSDLLAGVTGLPFDAGTTTGFLKLPNFVQRAILGEGTSSGGAGSDYGPLEYQIALAKLGLDERTLGLDERRLGYESTASEAAIKRAEEENYLEALGLQLEAELGRGNLSLQQLIAAGQLKTDESTSKRLERELDELMRANKARETLQQDELAAIRARDAISSYLQATELADARRLSAIQERRALLPSLVDPSQEYFSGLGPTGPLASVAGGLGLPFDPARIQHQQFDLGALTSPPGGAGLEALLMQQLPGLAGGVA